MVVPVVVILPGVLVIVQLPVGKPLNTTEPVGLVQLGWIKKVAIATFRDEFASH